MNKIKPILGWFLKDKKRIVAAILILVAAFFLYNRFFAKKADEVAIQTATVDRGTIVFSITASGTVIASNIENITTQASGTVSKVYVSDGDKVYAGQKLAEIDLDIEGQQNQASAYSTYISAVNSLNSAKNAYRSAQASLAVVYDEIKGHDTDETLQMKETRTKAEVANDNAYDGIKAAEAKLAAAALAYKTGTSVITSPISGAVRSVTIAEGMNIGAEQSSSGSRVSQRVATIATEGLPIASFNVSEIDVSQIKAGLKATITLDAISDKTFTGFIVSVDRVGITTNNVTNYPVIIKFDTEAPEVLSNMAASANIIIETKSNILLIPSSAIQSVGGQSIVKVMRDGQEQTTVVETGISNDSQTEIISGLSEGETVLIETSSVSTSSQTFRGAGGFIFPGAGGGPR